MFPSVDSVCINQDDVSERNSQVGLMGEIYRGESRVIVWLGNEDDNTKPALQSLKRSNFTPERYVEDMRLGLREFRRCNYTDEEKQAILLFAADRHWFSMLWSRGLFKAPFSRAT